MKTISNVQIRWTAVAVIALAVSSIAYAAAAGGDDSTGGTTQQAVGQPMPVEPDGGIGDTPIPVEPDGGIGDTPIPVEPDGGIGDTPDNKPLAAGSGCTPGSDDSLPDGEWFGYVDQATTTEIEFDLACWFNGEAAALATAEDGKESPPPNDYYVRNGNPGLRPLAVADGAAVTWFANPGDPSTEETVPYPEWLAGRASRGFQPGVWLTVDDSAVVHIREQYVP